MAYPPFFLRHTSYRQAESAGLPLDTSVIDSEFDDLAEIVSQVVRWLMGVTTATGQLKNLAAATAQALAGSQRFTAVAAQTVFISTIVYDASFSSASVLVSVNGVIADPATITVANNAGFLQVTRSIAAAGGEVVVVSAFSPGAGVLTRLANTASATDGAVMVGLFDADNIYAAVDVEAALREIRLLFNQFIGAINSFTGDGTFTATAGQTVFDCNVVPNDIIWDASLSVRNVFVYQNGVLLGPAAYTVADNAGFLRVTLGTPALVSDVVMIAGYSLSNIWTSGGVDLAGRPAQADFDLGGQNAVNLADGVNPQDAVTVNQLSAVLGAVIGAGAQFLRTNGTNSPTANVSWGGQKITNLGTPTAAADAATKAYADSADTALAAAIALKVAKAGDTMNAAANLTFTGGGEVLGLPATPSAAGAAASKAYVDGLLSSSAYGLSVADQSSGTITVTKVGALTKATKAFLSLYAGGGGGGASAFGSPTANGGGGGGGGGGAVAHFAIDLTLITTWNTIEITIGVAGTAGAAVGAGNGNPGVGGGSTVVTIRDAALAILFQATAGFGAGGAGGLAAGTPVAPGGAAGAAVINTASAAVIVSALIAGGAGGAGGLSNAGGGPTAGGNGTGSTPGAGGSTTGSNAGGGGGGGSGPDSTPATIAAIIAYASGLTGVGGDGGDATPGTGQAGAPGTGIGAGGGGGSNGTSSSYPGGNGVGGRALIVIM